MCIKYLLPIALTLVLLAGCSSSRSLVFADREWHISGSYGQIIDRDTTYRMTFGNVLIPDPLTIVSSADSLAKYPGMDRFLRDILHTCELDSAEILFYAPHMKTMFVIPGKCHLSPRPSTVSFKLQNERFFPMSVTDDDVETWTDRPSTEIYTYTFMDKRKKQLLIVSLYDYGDTPIAQISIMQSANKSTAKMNIPRAIQQPFFILHDLRRINRDIDFWARHVGFVRRITFANYEIGQEQKLRGK